MSPRPFIEFFKKPSGKLLVFGLLLTAVLVLVARKVREGRVPTMAKAEGGSGDGKPQLIESVNRPMEPFRPPPLKSEPPVGSAGPVPKPPEAVKGPVAVAPISLLADALAGETGKTEQDPVDAPFGRLIACETVVTVDSSRLQTPILGLTTADLYYGGSLVIPAGTEVHGVAQSDTARDRIASGTSWRLVWQTGEELRLRAMALDREFESQEDQVGWGITDGSAGLRGRLVKSDALAEAKLFAATFLQGFAGALTEKETTLLGSIDSRSLNNAPLKGADEVLGIYAQRVLDSIERDGFFIRVPSGKEFYLYVLEPIVLAHRDRPEPDGSEPTSTPLP